MAEALRLSLGAPLASDIMRTAGREAAPAETGTVGPAKRATEAPAAVIMRSICGKPLW